MSLCDIYSQNRTMRLSMLEGPPIYEHAAPKLRSTRTAVPCNLESSCAGPAGAGIRHQSLRSIGAREQMVRARVARLERRSTARVRSRGRLEPQASRALRTRWHRAALADQ